jgi:branched-chain amino acid aminotransferase
MKHYDETSLASLMAATKRPYQSNYFAMYSSLYDGIVTNPSLMTVPVDDHMVHRGDGIFETFKCVNGHIYNLAGHLDRLDHGVHVLGYRLAHSRARLMEAVVETIRAGGQRDCAVRLIVSRGPGSFDVNPYDSDCAQVYIVAYRLKPPFMHIHPEGATARTSSVPAKPPQYATVKTCNYLPNVLMRKEAADARVDFVLGYDNNGFLTEGATENIGLVTRRGDLLFPQLDGILAGTTMLRVMELARDLVRSSLLRRVAFADITRESALAATELLVVGTTLNVVSIREYDGLPVGTGKPGPIQDHLNRALEQDIASNSALLTPVFSR